MDNEILYILLALNFLVISICFFILYIIIQHNQEWKKRFAEYPLPAQYIFHFISALPLLTGPLLPQPQIKIAPLLTLSIGANLIVFGLIGFIYTYYHKAVIVSVNDKPRLRTNGFYAFVRNPCYFSLLLVALGYFIICKSIIFLYSLPLLISYLYLLSLLKEKTLREEHNLEFDSYSRKVRKRIIPFIL